MWMFFQVTQKRIVMLYTPMDCERKHKYLFCLYIYVYLDSYLSICSVLLIVFMDGESCLSHFILVLAVTELRVTSFFEMEDELYPVLLKSEMNTFYYLKEPLY